MNTRACLLLFMLATIGLAGCHRAQKAGAQKTRAQKADTGSPNNRIQLPLGSNNRSTKAQPAPNSPAVSPVVDRCSAILARHPGDGKLDQQIRKLQEDIPQARQPALLIERLGWLYVDKARASFDPGFYKLAELSAGCLEEKSPGAPEAWLLRGHALQSLHRFREAEQIARRLVRKRGLPLDHGLLGDVLMEQGNLPEAIAEYQTMVNAKPDAWAYARIAHMRWLKGDLAGASDAMQMAADATGSQAAEPAAWIHSRLGFYHLQAGDYHAARLATDTALALQSNYPPALLLAGRIHLAQDQPEAAIDSLRLASHINPLPEYQWALLESLSAAGQTNEATEVERQLLRTGAANDPRTFSLFLATRRLRTERAVQLAGNELRERADVHTHDAVAWTMAAAGRWEEALGHSQLAIAEGTADGRLHLHAGLIALQLDRRAEAQASLAAAAKYRASLLPSERSALDGAVAKLAAAAQSVAVRNQ